LESLRRATPELHESLVGVITRHLTRLTFYGAPDEATPHQILRSELESLEAELKLGIPNFADASAHQIALGTLVEWLLRCPLDFPPYSHAA